MLRDPPPRCEMTVAARKVKAHEPSTFLRYQNPKSKIGVSKP